MLRRLFRKDRNQSADKTNGVFPTEVWLNVFEHLSGPPPTASDIFFPNLWRAWKKSDALSATRVSKRLHDAGGDFLRDLYSTPAVVRDVGTFFQVPHTDCESLWVGEPISDVSGRERYAAPILAELEQLKIAKTKLAESSAANIKLIPNCKTLTTFSEYGVWGFEMDDIADRGEFYLVSEHPEMTSITREDVLGTNDLMYEVLKHGSFTRWVNYTVCGLYTPVSYTIVDLPELDMILEVFEHKEMSTGPFKRIPTHERQPAFLIGDTSNEIPDIFSHATDIPDWIKSFQSKYPADTAKAKDTRITVFTRFAPLTLEQSRYKSLLNDSWSPNGKFTILPFGDHSSSSSTAEASHNGNESHDGSESAPNDGANQGVA